VGVDALGDVAEYFVVEFEPAEARLALQDRHACFKTRARDLGNQAPLKSADEPVFELGDLAGRGVRANNNLAVGLEELVERVEKLFLGALFVGQEVDVIDDEHVRVAVAVTELAHLAGGDGLDELVHKAFARNINNPEIRLLVQDALTNRLQEVRLTQAHAAVNEQRVVGHARLIGDGGCCGCGKVVVGAGDEGLKGVIRREDRDVVIVVVVNRRARKPCPRDGGGG